MAKWYGVKANKYSPPSNTALVEAARNPQASVAEGSGAGDVVPGAVDSGVDVGGESAVSGGLRIHEGDLELVDNDGNVVKSKPATQAEIDVWG